MTEMTDHPVSCYNTAAVHRGSLSLRRQKVARNANRSGREDRHRHECDRRDITRCSDLSRGLLPESGAFPTVRRNHHAYSVTQSGYHMPIWCVGATLTAQVEECIRPLLQKALLLSDRSLIADEDLRRIWSI